MNQGFKSWNFISWISTSGYFVLKAVKISSCTQRSSELERLHNSKRCSKCR
jgi:hypothetical protein